MPVYKPGDFYIQRTGSGRKFFLRQNDATWREEGRLVTSGVIGLFAQGRFIGGEKLQMALAPDRLHFYPEYSLDRSNVHFNFTPNAPTSAVFVADLAAYLQDGSTLICTATWDAGPSNAATLVFEDIVVEPFTSMFCILPDTPDATAAGLHASLAAELV